MEKIHRTFFTEFEIQNRLLLAMINEASQILADGIVEKATDIDLVTVHGYGFPRWRGGLMHYADQIGASEVLRQLRELEKEDPIVWRPCQLIVDCAELNINFAEWGTN